ncbi:MAG: hypothetical protein ACYDAH_10140 [Steroidobacteraceae bacterium]
MERPAMKVTENSRNVTRSPPAPLPVRAAAPLASLRQRTERWMVRSLPQARYQLMRVGPAGLTGIGVLAAAVIAAIVLLLPAHQSVVALREELTKAGHAMPSTVKPAQSPEQFAATLPTRAQIPAILKVVLAQASEAGVALDQGRYTFSPATSNRLARYTFEFPVKANYGNIRSFIDKSLAALPALGLDKLHVERKTVGDIVVSADVGFVIYLRGA